MAEALKDTTRMAEETARRLAKGQAEVFRKYADLLSGYASHSLGSRAFGEGLLKLAVDQTTRVAEDALEIGSRYWRWVLNVGEVERRATEPESEGGARKSRRSRTPRKAR